MPAWCRRCSPACGVGWLMPLTTPRLSDTVRNPLVTPPVAVSCPNAAAAITSAVGEVWGKPAQTGPCAVASARPSLSAKTTPTLPGRGRGGKAVWPLRP